VDRSVVSSNMYVLGLFSSFLGVVGAAWWQDSHLAERVLNARAYHHSLKDVESMLPTLKAQGYGVINLDWPVEAGPVVLYGGFAAKDYLNVEPAIGTQQDWLDLVTATHALDMKIISWFNPSYLWTGADIFKKAEADAKQYFTHNVDYSALPADSPARFFRWQKTCGSGASKPDCPLSCENDDQCSGCGFYKGDHFVYSTDADACYYSVWSDQPSGDFARPEWQQYMKQVLEHWVGTGLDGFMLDWPQGYVGSKTTSGDASDPLIIQKYIKDIVKPLGDIAVFGETYNADDTPWSFTSVLDGAIDDSFPSGGHMKAQSLDYDLSYCDRLQGAGIVPRTSVQMPANGGPQATQEAALAALLGGYYALHATGQKEVANGDYGDFGSWKGEDAFSVVLKVMQQDPTLHPGSSRKQVSSGSNKAYAAVRSSADGKHHTLVVFNLDKKTGSLQVDLSGTAWKALQTCVDKLSGLACEPISKSLSWTHSLPPYGFGAFSFNSTSVLV